MFFEREDWSLFRTLDGLQQRAGVPRNKLSRLVLKELADNGLDNGAEVTVKAFPGLGGYVVEDNGTGLQSTTSRLRSSASMMRMLRAP
jgi:hypothetical protein